MRDVTEQETGEPRAPLREWVTPDYARIGAGDAEASPNPIQPDGGAFSSGS